MSNHWIIERATSGRGEEIASLIRRSLAARLHPLTIWGSPAAALYVESLLRGNSPDEAHEFYLLRRDNGASGVAALRRLEGSAFLNHLYIAPSLRGHGLGGRLFHAALGDYLCRYPARRVLLDVFADTSAEAWYHRLGLRERGRRGWWVAGPAPCPAPRIARNGRSTAWGFSTFVLYTAGGRRYEVGSLYGPYFRLTDPRAALDAQLHHALARIDASRRLLLVSTGDPSAARWAQIASSRRLACDAAPLLASLAEKTGKALPA